MHDSDMAGTSDQKPDTAVEVSVFSMDKKIPPSAQPPLPPTQAAAETVREVTPIAFDKDVMDFRPEENDEATVAPKGSSAMEPVSVPGLPTGLEDVSVEDLENPTVPTSAGTE